MKSESCRIALSALLHDLGKITQRAKIYDNHPRMAGNKNEFCPFQKKGKEGYHSHIHAACTAISMDELEEFFPDIISGNVAPFSSRSTAERDITDCLSNAAARHHKPESFLQWCIAIADRIASGFEREEFEEYNRKNDRKGYITTELMTLFEQVNNDRVEEACDYSYPLGPLSVASMFPHEKQKRGEEQAAAEYRYLWESLGEGIREIPSSHRKNWGLWLDHFDSLWLTMSHAVPSATAFGTKPEVSLYDHSKTTAALAVALWRFHHETGDEETASVREDWKSEKFMLIQGDFFGIQDFIFNSETISDGKQAKLLRGRSFFVSLLCECAALRLLDELDLPPTSQIINAAGKFLIVAPNTDKTLQTVREVQQQFDGWFQEHTLGLAGIGLACCEASPFDFTLHGENKTDKAFERLKRKLTARLDRVKYQRMGLCADTGNMAIMEVDYGNNICPYDKRLPANYRDSQGNLINKINHDQITLGGLLAREDNSRLLIFSDGREIGDHSGKLITELFGYTVLLTKDESVTGKFGELADRGILQRAFDISLPGAKETTSLWKGYSRRNINAFVPTHKINPADNPLYQDITEQETFRTEEIKTFEYLACDDRTVTDDNRIIGVKALGILKGDVDNLGDIFQHNSTSFAKLASLSRQINNFFSLYLPWLCRTEPDFQDIYTVFAGGDDFYMIGPWYRIQKFAASMRDEFRRYVANNAHIHFSAGYVAVKPGLPLRILSEQVEQALDKAKAYDGNGKKDAMTVFDRTVPWSKWHEIMTSAGQLSCLAEEYDLSTAYLYDILELVNMAEKIGQKPENARWRSLFYYRTRRMVNNDETKLNDIARNMETGMARLSGNYRIPLFNHIYRKRT